ALPLGHGEPVGSQARQRLAQWRKADAVARAQAIRLQLFAGPERALDDIFPYALERAVGQRLRRAVAYGVGFRTPFLAARTRRRLTCGLPTHFINSRDAIDLP